jgi:hypothetical protein
MDCDRRVVVVVLDHFQDTRSSTAIGLGLALAEKVVLMADARAALPLVWIVTEEVSCIALYAKCIAN